MNNSYTTETKVDPSPKQVIKQSASQTNVNPMLQMQKHLGNQAMQKMFQSNIIQAKLTVGEPGDKYEQEADRVADQVMRMPDSQVQRAPKEEEEKKLQTKPITPISIMQREPLKDEEEKHLQSKEASTSAPQVDSGTESSINNMRGGGQPLPSSVREYFEPRFGYDFSNVKVHTDSQAAESAQAVNAKAFTLGRDVAFGAGQYSPESEDGKRLLAHELTHVVQQNEQTLNRTVNSSIKNTIQRDTPEDKNEKSDPNPNKNTSSDFNTWPQMSNPLPDQIVNQVTANRESVATMNEKDLYKKTGGFAYNGKASKPTEVLTPEEENDSRKNEILTRLRKELEGEGKTSAVMTGDGAGFTWGAGLAHGGALEEWVNDFLSKCPKAKEDLLKYGIALEGTIWKIINTESKNIMVDKEAISLINGSESAGQKRKLLSIFAKVSEDYGVAAEDAQWKLTKKKYFYKNSIPDEVIKNTDAWTPKAICYVIHCSMWGSFAGWNRFQNTGGDLHKILRMEVDFTGFYEDKGDYLLVNPFLKGMNPSVTMLCNMGARCMIDDGIVQPIKSPEQAGKGDVVFKMYEDKATFKITPSQYYVLGNVAKQFDPNEEMNIFIANVQSLPMDSLIKKLKSLGYQKVLKMKNWYASESNPKKEIFGLRPRIAMDAVLHQSEGSTASWILSDCVQANITDENNPDQIKIIKKTIGIA